MKQKITSRNLLKNIRFFIPEFITIEKKEAVDEADEEHYVMSILNKFAEEVVLQKNVAILKKIAYLLNECWKIGEFPVQNAIIVSFFEGLSQKSFHAIKPLLSKSLTAEAEHYRMKWAEWLKQRKKLVGSWKLGKKQAKYLLKRHNVR